MKTQVKGETEPKINKYSSEITVSTEDKPITAQ
jgi:hypothetical protein